MFTIIITCLLAAIVAGLSGYLLAFRFHRSKHAATDRSGDFGTPRGSFFATMGGMLVGQMFVFLLSLFPTYPTNALAAASITSMIAGAVAGFVGMYQGNKVSTRQ